jgi:hypothetical protein
MKRPWQIWLERELMERLPAKHPQRAIWWIIIRLFPRLVADGIRILVRGVET